MRGIIGLIGIAVGLAILTGMLLLFMPTSPSPLRIVQKMMDWFRQ